VNVGDTEGRARAASAGSTPPSAWGDAVPVRQRERDAVHPLWLSGLIAERPVVTGVQPSLR